MLEIKIPDAEYYNEDINEFYTVKGGSLILEHSLLSISKWESKWKKPFLHKDGLTQEEVNDYVRCMTVSNKVDPRWYQMLSHDNIEAIKDYINDSMTATWFREDNTAKPSREIITSELIYYWMVSLNIPFECQKWHLNRLITLIRVCSIKNAPPKKMSKKAQMTRQHALNEARKKKLHTTG